MLLMERKINDSIKYIREKTEINAERQPEIGVILGSGLGVLADELEESVVMPYKSIPHFPVSTVAGHKGQLVLGNYQEISYLYARTISLL